MQMACFGPGDLNLSFNFTKSDQLNYSTVSPGDRMNLSSQPIAEEGSTLLNVTKFFGSILVPTICIFGMMGNLMTLLVLTRKRIKSSCDGTERTVHVGLIALALSDFLICFCVLPYGFMADGTDRFDYTTKDFPLIYKTYSETVINTFILTSTWLTVTMATSRYIAIVHPFRARHLVGMTGTVISIFVVVIACITLNIPNMLEYEIQAMPCIDGSYIYFKKRYLNWSTKLRQIYLWVYFTIGICVPQTALAFCNICLVKALWNSSKLRKRYRVPTAHVDSNYRITSILVTIVVMHILLVSPAEILRFLNDRLIENENGAPDSLIIAEEFTNVLQTVNFSFNFILYFILNVHFRKALKDIFCVWRKTPVIQHPKFRAIPRATSDLSKQGETSQTFVLDSKEMHAPLRCPSIHSNRQKKI